MGGKAPYGFHTEPIKMDGINTKKLVVNPDEAANIRLMFEMYAQPTTSYGDITRYFAEQGILFHGKELIRPTLAQMLRNPVYSVIRSGIFVELFGLEIFVPLSELSYQRWLNAEDHFVVGQRVLVQILSIARDDPETLGMTVSVKRAAEESFLASVARYKVNDLYIGTVSMITTAGVFVSLDGVDCLCRFPRRGRPPLGTNVTVKILGIDSESKRIWGVIVH